MKEKQITTREYGMIEVIQLTYHFIQRNYEEHYTVIKSNNNINAHPDATKDLKKYITESSRFLINITNKLTEH